MSAFFTLAVIHFLGLVSPGPDFALMTKQSLTRSRREAICTALGIALANFTHATYCILGIGIVISNSILLYNTIKYIGAAYLLFLGIKALFHKSPTDAETCEHITKSASSQRAMVIGFLGGILNPKATLFFLALFTQVIGPETPFTIQFGYAIYMMSVAFLWFSFLASVLTLERIRHAFRRAEIWIERVMGAVLIALGLKVAFASHE